MRSRTFLNVSLGILALAAAYHFGAQTATAQAPGNPVVAVSGSDYVYTANGDVYRPVTGFPDPSSWAWVGNVFGGGPIPLESSSWGSVKARYRGEREPQGVKPSTGR